MVVVLLRPNITTCVDVAKPHEIHENRLDSQTYETNSTDVSSVCVANYLCAVTENDKEHMSIRNVNSLVAELLEDGLNGEFFLFQLRRPSPGCSLILH